MGDSINQITQPITNLINQTPGASSIPSPGGSGISGITNAASQIPGINLNISDLLGGGVAGLGADEISNLVSKLVPAVPIADQTNLNNQIANQQNLSTQFSGQQQNLQNAANAQQSRVLNNNLPQGQSAIDTAQNTLNLSQQGLGQNQGAINNAQGAVNTAQQTNLGPNSNVTNAIGLIGQTAAGAGAAQQAAKAQLQAGTDQAIATQHALANSGNLSQQLAGQKAAMDNSAILGQQNALNASALQAQMAAGAQGQYAGAAGQQASQSAQNAGLQQAQTQAQMSAGAQQQQQAQLQQAQTAAQQAQTNQSQDVANAFANQAQGYAGQSNSAQQGALTGQTNALGIQQGALGQTSQYRAQALGGALNATGGGLALASDENLKTNISPIDSEQYNEHYSNNNDSSNSSITPNKQAGATLLSKSFNGLGTNNIATWQNIPEPLTSDKSSKKEIKSGNMVEAFLDALDPVSFKYKQPTGEMGQTPGEHIGVIAQQVEKAPGGKSMVIETNSGKGIDLASAVGTLLAAAAETHSRVKDLEELYKSRSENKRKK